VIAALLAAASLATCYLPPVTAEITVPYAQPACAYCPGHRGVDYALTPGTAVHAVAPGVVTFSGVVAGTRYVVVLQADGLRATYGLLQSPVVTRGDVVSAGQVTGLSGPTLYFGLRDAQDQPVNPMPLLGRLVGRARLVPPQGGAQRRAPPPRLTCSASVSGVFAV
jgi:murein DD-endopeptidase MepM/ murein hydrolase activator NlpD